MQKGFTFIELIMVVLIIGILAAIAIPAYQTYTARTQVTEALNMASAFKSEVISVFGERGVCPVTPIDLGLNSIGTIDSRYVKSLTINTIMPGALCAFEFTFTNKGMNNQIAGKTLIFAMMNYTSNGAAVWECTSSTIRQIYLPTICKGT